MEHIVVKGLGHGLKDAAKRVVLSVDSSEMETLAFSVHVSTDNDLSITEYENIDTLYSLIVFMFEIAIKEEISREVDIKRVMNNSQNYLFEISKKTS
ncbi:hypothetical protein J2125_003931 [Erwinia toletana]|uniref:Uncharacterized protein n=1 Tax=Winslowiella toletana TaxID=92490 RepID=A0ABS4PDM4_9GAMM|nr:hypothetical protein [Winslowiella toletana]MBP2170739.1 hypothetical protein [Winslowiella toletana]